MRLYATATSRLILKSRFTGYAVAKISSHVSSEYLIFINRHFTHPSEIKSVWHRQYHSTVRVGAKAKNSKIDLGETLTSEQFLRMIRSDPSDMMASADTQVNMEARQPGQQQKPNHMKRPHNEGKSKRGMKRENKKNQKKAKKKGGDMVNGSNEEVLAFDIQSLVESLNRDEEAAAAEESWDKLPEATDLPERGSEIDVDVVELSSTGEGLAVQKGSKQVYIVPFTVPGDTVKVKVYRHLEEEGYTVADLISVVKPSPSRDDSRVQCKYFAECSGCQFQMLDYAEQLKHKKRIVEKAYRNFSQLPPELVPAIQDTIGSPLQYGYRTKLTPHFDPPGGWRKGNKPLQERPAIGFMPKGKRNTIDIEDCPIGTDAVRMGMKNERARMEVEYGNYTRGATILLRESTKRIFKNSDNKPEEPESSSPKRSKSPQPPSDQVIRVETDEYTDLKTCVTDNNGTSTEYIGPYVFHNPAGSFFQNNNSILPTFTDYIREHVLPLTSPDTTTPQIKYLLDAYSGSGLFTITLSCLFPGGSVGIDVAASSIAFASRNAAANSLPPERAKFIAADASNLFTPNLRETYPADETAVVIDPPRKGCDASFLNQLLEFAPKRVVYVSCNVHSQARDVGILVRGEIGSEFGKAQNGDTEKSNGDVEMASGEMGEKKKKTRYTIESIRGFDFFPQTGHVEGVAVLNRVDD
ncbi:S-adenosyl-L-methionine-dependent methyltransferase [Hypoxylon trugodes]|uniref:S-adenosyl-L-methionine-dependent methyltransferase n=1 Tax=Hypoxylon trugodes TaxID=326681 RepID=UPI002191A879|nr:S-adenosyl-L-methionine-dependent methyltransferase [Hypoxylon trugodes]KAI1389154.1 S-adenosyl-L-methionine-dependent methyltransferase [Hypoxylon trugodes]